MDHTGQLPLIDPYYRQPTRMWSVRVQNCEGDEKCQVTRCRLLWLVIFIKFLLLGVVPLFYNLHLSTELKTIEHLLTFSIPNQLQFFTLQKQDQSTGSYLNVSLIFLITLSFDQGIRLFCCVSCCILEI